MTYYHCPECNYDVLDIFAEDGETNDCPLCGAVLEEVSTNENNELQSKIDKKKEEDSPEKLMIVDWLNYHGNNRTWQKIEEIKNTRKRILYRKIFFDLGGECPKRHLEELEE